MGDKVKNVLFKNKEGDLTAEEEDQIDNELLKITPDEAFNFLVKEYQLYYVLNPTEEEAKSYKNMEPKEITDILLKKYSLQDIRGYMLVAFLVFKSESLVFLVWRKSKRYFIEVSAEYWISLSIVKCT